MEKNIVNLNEYSKNCKRKWLNDSDDIRGSSGISIIWPDTSNKFFREALQKAKEGESPNNISPIIQYNSVGGIKFLWMGDLETEFMENIKDDVDFSKVNILFAPHHGRDSGKIPQSMLADLNPDIIIIGEAPVENLNYYKGYNTITQNSAGDITFVNDGKEIHIYVSNENYKVSFLKNKNKTDYNYYLGTLEID